MSKATNQKKVEPIKEEAPQLPKEEIKKPEKIIEPEVKIQKPIAPQEERPFVPDLLIEKKTPPVSKVEELSKEEKIEKYLEDKTGKVKINDFLKSLYPSVFNEPPAWQRQAVSRELRHILSKMQSENKLVIEYNRHLQLGDAYYPDGATMKTEYYNLNNIDIQVQK